MATTIAHVAHCGNERQSNVSNCPHCGVPIAPRLRIAAKCRGAAMPVDVQRARRSMWRFSLREADKGDLHAELEERENIIARLEASLANGIFDDGNAEQLRGGIANELFRIELLVTELEQRERARSFGYREGQSAVESDLPERFARIRAGGAAELADVLSQETGQPGRTSGGRWYFRCPFHNGGHERTESLVVYPDGRAHCFGCRWSGDAVDLVANLRGTTLVSALRLLEQGLV